MKNYRHGDLGLIGVDKLPTGLKESYIHIPFGRKRIRLFFLSLLSVGLVIANFYLLLFIGNTFKVWQLLGSGDEKLKTAYYSFSQLIIIYPLLGECILIGSTVICFVALYKGGFSNFKSFEEEGLFWGLIGGLFLGLVGGLIWWLFLGLIGGLTAEFD